MRYLSVCDGIGAIHLACQRLGWECVGTSEIASFPAAVIEHHFGFRNLGDMTNYRSWSEMMLANVDLLVGGTPCVSFSVAGERRSLDDERGNLTLVYVNLFNHINEVRKRHGRPPAIALWENVPGVLSTKDNAFGCLVGGLLGCDEAPQTQSGKWDKAGFLSSETVHVGYRILDAQHFALAQRRERVFLIAVPCELIERFGERACPSQILSLTESVLENPQTRGGERQEAPGIRGECLAQSVTRGEPERQDFDDCHSGDSDVVASSEVAGTLTACRGRGYRSNGTFVEGVAITPIGPRRMTPREYEHLQGFPADYTAIVNRKGKPASDSSRFKALGNSMAVPVMWWIVERIAKAIDKPLARTVGVGGPRR
jgi:DNA (cytosine-5)-methyltransferase 1